MKSPINRSIYQSEIKRSVFISVLFHADGTACFKDELTRIKKSFPDAKHYCYAYIIDGIKHSSDDGEPHGTAGRPILELLEKNCLDDVGLITVRYFGGIKLGVGLLLRTYVDTALNSIKKAEIGQIVELNSYAITLPNYDLFYELLKLSSKNDFTLENIVYGETIALNLVSKKEINAILLNSFLNHIKIDNIVKLKRVEEMNDEK
ncbi:MAG: YigZ family protein [Bacilli bacterium]|jgi:uncharacterized YigZ family protein